MYVLYIYVKYPLEIFKRRRSKVCSNVTEADTFSSTVTGETFQINHELNCDSKCLIYLLKCKFCKKQYVGETTDAFQGGTITRTMIENFREMKVACNNVFMSIFLAKLITDFWGIYRLVRLTKLIVFNLRKRKITE